MNLEEVNELIRKKFESLSDLAIKKNTQYNALVIRW